MLFGCYAKLRCASCAHALGLVDEVHEGRGEEGRETLQVSRQLVRPGCKCVYVCMYVCVYVCVCVCFVCVVRRVSVFDRGLN